MNRNSGLRVALVSVFTLFTALAQQQSFEIADVHLSPTARVLRRISGACCATAGTSTATRLC